MNSIFVVVGIEYYDVHPTMLKAFEDPAEAAAFRKTCETVLKSQYDDFDVKEVLFKKKE